MNPFVNFNQRDVQLPNGCTDLSDVLHAKKCDYCDDVAIATVGWPGDHRWCKACQRDLADFASRENYEAACSLREGASNAEFRADLKRRQDEFMRQRVGERHQSIG